MGNSIVIILCDDGDEQDAAYINGKLTVSGYYFSLEAIVWTAKALLNADVDIEYFNISRETLEELNGYPPQLPAEWRESWQLTEVSFNSWQLSVLNFPN